MEINDNVVAEVAEIQRKIDEAYRTDHITLPVPPIPLDPKIAEVSMSERELILNPKMNAKVGDITLEENTRRLNEGVPAPNSPQETMDGIGKHTIEVTGKTKRATKVTPPIGGKPAIFEPEKTNAFGVFGEVITVQDPIPEGASPTNRATEVSFKEPAKSPSDVPTDENTVKK